jgi:hypothetical protein
MTEAEWLASDDPQPMLTFLWERASKRKQRLLAVGFCHHNGTYFPSGGADPLRWQNDLRTVRRRIRS